MDAAETRTWDRTAAESAYESFRAYRDLGPTRTVRAAAGTQVGRRVPGHTERSAARHDWRARAMAWDLQVYRRQEDAVLAAIHPRPPLHSAPDFEPGGGDTMRADS